MATMFALVSAMLYGTADFLGGTGSRRAPALAVLSVSVPVGLAVMLAAAVFSGAAQPGGVQPGAAAFAWGALGGAAGAIGMLGFYAGLAEGPMSVVAPVSALAATVLPVGVALAGGEHPGGMVLAGSAVCLVAIAFVSMDAGGSGNGRPRWRPAAWRGLSLGAGAGIAFGLFFIFVKNAGQSGGLWPLAVSRGTGAAAIVAAAVLTRTRPVGWRGGRGLFALAVVSGAADALANIFYVLATRRGLFSLAVVLTSLYPAATVLLARVVLGERVRGLQQAGLVLAAVGIVLATSG